MKKWLIRGSIIFLVLVGIVAITNKPAPTPSNTRNLQVEASKPQQQTKTTSPPPASTPQATTPTPTTTETKPSCDPNYSGACVPNVYPSDVDCAGGSGNGPYYVQGPVQVIGTDIYGLDGNHDGVGCQ